MRSESPCFFLFILTQKLRSSEATWRNALILNKWLWRSFERGPSAGNSTGTWRESKLNLRGPSYRPIRSSSHCLCRIRPQRKVTENYLLHKLNSAKFVFFFLGRTVFVFQSSSSTPMGNLKFAFCTSICKECWKCDQFTTFLNVVSVA